MSHITVVILGLPVNKQGQFLLTKRNAPHVAAWHEKWQIAGGKMEFGESPLETLIREFKEEVGVTVEPIFPHPIVLQNMWTKQQTKLEFDRQVLLITYVCKIIQGQPKANNQESLDVGWFDFEDAIKLDLLPMAKETIVEAKKILQEKKLSSL